MRLSVGALVYSGWIIITKLGGNERLVIYYQRELLENCNNQPGTIGSMNDDSW